jgi:hypothetical protein
MLEAKKEQDHMVVKMVHTILIAEEKIMEK